MKAISLLTALLTAALLCACRQDMNDQAKYGPLKKSDFYQDGASSRTPPAHTVARGDLHQDAVFYTGRINDKEFTATLPVPLTPALLKRGEERFNIYCAVCHGEDGYAQGIVVRRGFPAPPSYHDDRLRQVADGYLYDVITRGHGVMLPFADRLTVDERWAVVAYIRALQRSQHVALRDLPAADQARFNAP